MRRYERASTRLTSNRPVEDWGKLLGDVAAVAAMLDRILRQGHLLKCGPRSWRTKSAGIPIGVATGFLFYWACIILGFTATKREVVLNPLSALALSAIGGWLQTEVFTIIWGVVRPRTKA